MSYLFAFKYCSWSSQGKNTEVVYHSLLQWTTFCQNSLPWPIRLVWPYMAWLIVSLIRLVKFSVTVVFTLSALWWKNKRLLEASWWERLIEGETGSGFDGPMKIMLSSFKQSHACAAILSASNPAAGHHGPTPPWETHGHSWASLGQIHINSSEKNQLCYPPFSFSLR